MTRIAWIGIGRMGWPMAAQLLKAGQPIAVCDPRANRLKASETFGTAIYEHPEEAAQGVKTAILCVTDKRAAEDAVFGPRGVAKSMQRGGIVVDHGTMDPDECREMALRAQLLGLYWIDAPVSRQASAGVETLTSWLAGDDQAIETVTPLLSQYIAHISPVGPSGSAQAVKCCNQLIVGGTAALWDASLELGRSYGIPSLELVRLLENGAAGSQVRDFIENGLRRGCAVAETFANAPKDLCIALNQMEKRSISTQMVTASLARIGGDVDCC